VTIALTYLAYVVVFTGLLWLPYVLDRIVVGGLGEAVGYPEHPKPQSGWAQRLKKAHANAVENLVVFAPLVLIAHVVGRDADMLANAATLYFWSRVVHAVAYTFAIPLVRTLSFFGGFVGQCIAAWCLFAPMYHGAP